MALPVFVVTPVGRGLWNEISEELVTTRLTKYSKTTFAIQMLYPHKARNWVSHDSGTDFRIFLETNNHNIINMLHNTRDIHN
jgi:hypothetical protein